MKSPAVLSHDPALYNLLSGGGEMGRRIHSFDWSATLLGPLSTWPQSLLSTLSICLHSDFPSAVYWGEQSTLLYNNAWISIAANKHPWALGRPAKEVWPEMWATFEPQFQKAYNGQSGSCKEVLLIQRHGNNEKHYFDFSFTPVYGESGKVDGIFSIVTEKSNGSVDKSPAPFLQKATGGNDGTLEQELYNLLMQAPVGIVVFSGPHYVIELANDRYLPIAGKSREELLHKRAFEAMPAAAGQGFIELLDNIRATGTPFELHQHETLIERNGQVETTYLDIVYQPLKERGGSVNKIMIVVTEVTEQVAVRKKIEERELHLKNIISQVNAGIAQCDVQGNFVEVNERYCEITGYTKEDLLQKNIAAIIHPYDRQQTLLLYQQCNEGKSFFTEKRYLAKDGSVIWANNSVSLITGGNGEKFVTTVCIDTSEQKKVLSDLNKKIREISDYKYALDESSIVAITDQKGIIQYVNDYFCKISKYSAEELIGQDHRIINSGYHSKEYIRNLWVTIANGKIWKGELKNKAKDGTYYWVDTTIVPFLNEQGKPYQYVAIRSDITARKEAEEKIKFTAALTQNIADALIGTDTEYKITSWNRGAEVVYGWKAEEVIGKSAPAILQTVFPSQDPTEWQTSLHTRGYWQGEVVQKRKNGARVPVLASIAYVKDDDGKVVGAVGVNRDITAQKEAEEALKESNQRFQAAVAAVQGILWTNNAQGQMEGEQAGWAALTGQSYEEYQGYGWSKAVHPDDAQPTVDAWNEAVRQRRMFVFEHRVWMKNGQLGQFSVRAIPLLNSDGSIREWVGVHTNVTEQRRAEEALKQSEEQFRIFGNNIQNLAWIADGAGWIFWYNQRWYDYTGTNLEEMQGWGWEKVHHPEHNQRVVDFVKEAWKKPEPFELTFPLRGADGVYRWFLTRVYPVKDAEGKIYRWIGTNTDIHEQKLAEERFRTLAETLPNLVWMTNDKGIYEYASSRWEEYSGFNPRQEDAWQKIVHPDDMQPVMDVWLKSLNTGQTYHTETRLKNREGEYRWHVVQGEPIRNEEGKIMKWIGAFTDIHDQKTLTEKLEKLVTERTEALQRSNEDLQQFAHVASHDLKEPLRKIKTFGSRLQDEVGHQLPDKARTYLEKMDSAITRMYNMIEGVLAYSSLNAYDQTLEPVDLNEVVQHITSDLEVLIQQKSAVIQHGQLPTIEGASILIYQLFYNLINNSLKFSRTGVPPVIAIYSRVAEVSELEPFADVSMQQQYVEIRIKDNGIGFSQDYAERIFKTFARLNARDKYEGTGLGLALCRKIVQRHGGFIAATGNEGEGATFQIILPVKQM